MNLFSKTIYAMDTRYGLNDPFAVSPEKIKLHSISGVGNIIFLKLPLFSKKASVLFSWLCQSFCTDNRSNFTKKCGKLLKHLVAIECGRLPSSQLCLRMTSRRAMCDLKQIFSIPKQVEFLEARLAKCLKIVVKSKLAMSGGGMFWIKMRDHSPMCISKCEAWAMVEALEGKPAEKLIAKYGREIVLSGVGADCSQNIFLLESARSVEAHLEEIEERMSKRLVDAKLECDLAIKQARDKYEDTAAEINKARETERHHTIDELDELTLQAQADLLPLG